jgi:hypothetical protein
MEAKSLDEPGWESELLAFCNFMAAIKGRPLAQAELRLAIEQARQIGELADPTAALN